MRLADALILHILAKMTQDTIYSFTYESRLLPAAFISITVLPRNVQFS